MNPDQDLAKQRFLFLSLVRLGGAVFLTLGLVILSGRTDMQQELGLPFALIGAVGFLVVPWHLARKWRSPRP